MSKKTQSTKNTSAKKTPKPANPDRVPLTQMDREKKATKAKKPSGLDAAAQVLKDAGQPMRCKDLVDAMLTKGLWTTLPGRNPLRNCSIGLNWYAGKLLTESAQFRNAPQPCFPE